MVHRSRFCILMLGVLLGWGVLTTSAHAEDAETIAGPPAKTLPTPPRKSLPARDCISCPGPPASAPCFDTHRGFLYYGTYPWDDDPVNGFNDCPRGECGYPGATLSLAWMRCRQGNGAAQQHQSTDCPTCNSVPHSLRTPLPAVAAPQAEETYR